ncbi:MAG: radical SAM peptide maturase, CXXX-repeat target family [Clostridiales bacterium]|nr:radical SAM peptide maturase, CXXX-repeat target family [Clostridiales bacterium]
MKKTNVYMGSMTPTWMEHKKIKNITFSVTDDCNLRCTYCYFTHKNCKNVMSLSTAKLAVDNILSDKRYDDFDGAVWEFIGGEPTLEMALIDQISDYILIQMYRLNHKWLYCYRFMIGTNGILYEDKKFQSYISKHNRNLYVGVTIDGSKEKHDLSRIKPDGTGSYDDVAKIIPMWKNQIGAYSTKATFSHNDLPYLMDSIVNLWNLGLNNVAANIVFEDVWDEKDVDIYRQQLYKLANYIIENNLWETHSVRFFDPNVGNPVDEISMRRNFCGSGTMLAINSNGDYYPCVRFMPSATNNHIFGKIGDVYNGINPDKLRPFSVLNVKNQSSDECLKCDISGGCTWCSGLNFDCSSIGTIFERQTFHCKMHKANVEVNKYLWRQYELIKHEISPYRYLKLTTTSKNNKYLYIIGDSEFPSFCEYKINSNLKAQKMTKDILNDSIRFCEENNFVPIFCGFRNLPLDYYGYQMILYKDLLNGNYANFDNYIPHIIINVNEAKDYKINDINITNMILTLKASQLGLLMEAINNIINCHVGISINISITEMDIEPIEFIRAYTHFLDLLIELIIEFWNNQKYFMINLLTYEMVANSKRNCGAGDNSFTVSPDGNIYICPGFYHNSESPIGSVNSGIVFNRYCSVDSSPLCSSCNINHCKYCVLKNIIGTGEYSIPTELQCAISHLEYNYSTKLIELLSAYNIGVPFKYNKKLSLLENYDPIIGIRGTSYINNGYNNLLKELMSDDCDTLIKGELI